MAIERFYENDKPQCQQRCVVAVGASRILKICICELIEGHAGDCERVPTTRWATVDDMARLPVYKKFVSDVRRTV
jgi:hypothetical protein